MNYKLKRNIAVIKIDYSKQVKRVEIRKGETISVECVRGRFKAYRNEFLGYIKAQDTKYLVEYDAKIKYNAPVFTYACKKCKGTYKTTRKYGECRKCVNKANKTEEMREKIRKWHYNGPKVPKGYFNGAYRFNKEVKHVKKSS